MNNLSKLDFTGQHIYVGMDVHRKSWSIRKNLASY